MTESITFSPPNSLILVMDHEAGELPEQVTSDLIAATNSCLAIGTLAAADGETTVSLTDALDVLDACELAFDGMLLTPNFELSVCNVKNEKLLTMQVPNTSTRVRVFANDPYEPDQIVIVAE